MLNSIGIKYFKSFEELKPLHLKPITILCGANSSGKSSIIKSILTLKQSFDSEKLRNSLLVNGKYVNNGSFQSIIHNQVGSTVEFINTFIVHANSNNIDGHSLDRFTYKLLSKMFKKNIKKAEYNEYQLTYRLVFMETAHKNNGYISESIIDLFELKIDCLSNKELMFSSEIVMSRNRKQDYQYKITWNNLPNQTGESKSGGAFCQCYFSGLQLTNVSAFSDMDIKNVNEILPNLLSSFQIIIQQYKTISYIGPLREEPARRYILENEVIDIGVKGENAPYIFYTTNYILKRLLTISNSDLLDFKTVNTSFKEAVRIWMEYLGVDNFDLGEKNEEIIRLLIDSDNIADVGFGVSQAFPIVVEGLRMNKDSTLILEQPEIHLHPKMQMKLADFFIAMALSGKKLLIETHSDHIINRLVRRIMEDEKNNLLSLVNIYFVTNNCRKSTLELIEIDEVKGITSWPKDFFDQYASETRQIIYAGLNNLKKRKQQINNNNFME